MDVSKYRPISILTSFSEIFGKVMYRRLLEHVINNNIITNEQFGFGKNLRKEKKQPMN
jgi:hypothetical protein